MIYHEVGDSGLRLSALGFGTMRWPDEEECHRIMHRGMDLGMNYVDTSTGYIGGRSYKWVANAIRGRRDEVVYSSKSHWAQAPSADTVYRTIEDVLAQTGLDCVDLHQVWGVGSVQMVKDALKKGGTVEGVRRAQKRGLVKHGIGFTFHGPADAFRHAVDSGEFLTATVSYNLLNRQEEAQIDYAAERGVAVLVMNPLAGGPLAMSDDRRLDFLRRAGAGPCYGALRFLLANQHITTALLGLSSVDQVDEDIRALDEPERLNEEYRQRLIRHMDGVEFAKGSLCTGCGYCKDCPQGFNPTQFMEYMRDFSMYGMNEERLFDWLSTRYAQGGRTLKEVLDLCVGCGQCEEKCPQHLPIVQEIERAKGTLR